MEFIKLEKQNQIATITIDRPKALNALNNQVLDELNQAIDELEKEKDLRCLIITGSGEKSFVAGADIKEMQGLSAEEAEAFANKGQMVFRRLEILSCPVIAAVNGFAFGGGLELAMACDFIYASENAVFGLPEVSLGLIPGFGGTQRLAKFVGLAKAKEMIFTAGRVKAEQAVKLGIAIEVLPSSELMSSVNQIAGKIANLAPIAISAAKGACNQGYDLAIDPGMHLERNLFGQLFKSKDVKTGIEAFINKEKPTFLGE